MDCTNWGVVRVTFTEVVTGITLDPSSFHDTTAGLTATDVEPNDAHSVNFVGNFGGLFGQQGHAWSYTGTGPTFTASSGTVSVPTGIKITSTSGVSNGFDAQCDADVDGSTFVGSEFIMALGGTSYGTSSDIGNDGDPSLLLVENSGFWPTDCVGNWWKIITAPAGFAVPQYGIVGP